MHPPLVYRAAVYTSATAAGLFIAPTLFAQQNAPTTRPTTEPVVAAQSDGASTDARFDRLERRLADMERQHQQDLDRRDQEIARLKAQLQEQQQQQQQQSTAPATGPSTSPPPSQDEIDQTTAEMLKDIDKQGPLPVTQRTPASFNPNFAVVGDFAGNVSTLNADPARNRFNVREVELDLRAAVDPRADAVVILPVDFSVADPLFFDPAKADGSLNTSISIEEAYMFLHDFGVPNLTAQLGEFHLRFGRWNILHMHDWPTVDNNFVNQSFLGRESLADGGLSLDYVVPPKYVGNQWIEAIAQVVSGEGSEDQPVVNNNAFVQSPAFNGHLLWNHDVAKDWNLELGGSFYAGKHNADVRQSTFLYGLDTTLIHQDPSGKFNNQIFEAEAIYGTTDTSRVDTQHSLGAYVLAQQQINHDWYAGVRLDWTKDALNEHRQIWGVSPYLSWYWSEFLRWRIEYQHRGGAGLDARSEDALLFQATFIFGAHPPHPYWAMR